MSHDTRICPDRFGRQHSLPEPAYQHKEEADGKRRRDQKLEVIKPTGPRGDQIKRRGGRPTERGSPKPLHRDLMKELGEALDGGEEKRAPKLSTKEWVRKYFGRGEAKERETVAQEILSTAPPASETYSTGTLAPWYMETVHEEDVHELCMLKTRNEKRQKKMSGALRWCTGRSRFWRHELRQTEIARVGGERRLIVGRSCKKRSLGLLWLIKEMGRS